MLKNSRTTKSNTLVRALAWNMPFHAEHHAYPWFPFHALPRVHRLISARVETRAPGYAAVLSALVQEVRVRP